MACRRVFGRVVSAERIQVRYVPHGRLLATAAPVTGPALSHRARLIPSAPTIPLIVELVIDPLFDAFADFVGGHVRVFLQLIDQASRIIGRSFAKLCRETCQTSKNRTVNRPKNRLNVERPYEIT